MNGIRARILNPTSEDMVAEVELENGDIITVLDEDRLLEDAETGEAVTIEGIVVPNEIEVGPKDEMPEQTGIISEAGDDGSSLEVVADIQDTSMEEPWPDVERDQPLVLAETDIGEIAIERGDLPEDEKGDFNAGKRARILTDQIVLVNYEEGDWDA